MTEENKKDDQTAAREASLSAPAGSARDCRGCWWQEGGRCYEGEDFQRDEKGRSNKMATQRCDKYYGKRAALETVIPGDMLVIASEQNDKSMCGGTKNHEE